MSQNSMASVTTPPTPIAPRPVEGAVTASPASHGKAIKEKDKDKGKDRDGDDIAIEDLSLPKSIVTRLAKSALPPNTQLQKESVTALSKSATVFINHIASAAQENLNSTSKKTLQPANVMAALEETEFAFMIPALEAELEKFLGIQSAKRSEYKKKTRESKGGEADSKNNKSSGAASENAVDRLDNAAGGGDGDEVEDQDPAAMQLYMESTSASAAKGTGTGGILRGQGDGERSAKRVRGPSGTAVPVPAEEDEDEEDVDMTGIDGAEEPEGGEDEVEDDEVSDDDATEEEGEGADEEDRVGTEAEDDEGEEESGEESD